MVLLGTVWNPKSVHFAHSLALPRSLLTLPKLLTLPYAAQSTCCLLAVLSTSFFPVVLLGTVWNPKSAHSHKLLRSLLTLPKLLTLPFIVQSTFCFLAEFSSSFFPVVLLGTVWNPESAHFVHSQDLLRSLLTLPKLLTLPFTVQSTFCLLAEFSSSFLPVVLLGTVWNPESAHFAHSHELLRSSLTLPRP